MPSSIEQSRDRRDVMRIEEGEIESQQIRLEEVKEKKRVDRRL